MDLFHILLCKKHKLRINFRRPLLVADYSSVHSTTFGVTKVTAGLVSPTLAGVKPMNAPIGNFFYVDYTISNIYDISGEDLTKLTQLGLNQIMRIKIFHRKIYQSDLYSRYRKKFKNGELVEVKVIGKNEIGIKSYDIIHKRGTGSMMCVNIQIAKKILKKINAYQETILMANDYIL